MSNDITPLRRSDVLDGIAKFFRVLEKEDVEWAHYQLPISSKVARHNLAEYLKLSCPRVKKDGTISANPTGYELARLILGNNFITPEEITDARNLTYGSEQLAMFTNTLPLTDVIRWCQANGFMIVAGPPSPMSLLQIHNLNPLYFCEGAGGWCPDEEKRFSRKPKVERRWLAIRMGSVPNSSGKIWDDQQSLLSDVEYVPNDAEVAWAITTYKAVRDIFLLRGVLVRTSSMDSRGRLVHVGNADPLGLDVGGTPADRGNVCLGIASARRL